MGPAQRLSITCVRPADSQDPVGDLAPGERVLVVGQPVVGRVRLLPQVDGSWTLTELVVPDHDPHKMVRMLLQGAFGVVLDAGGSLLRAETDHPALSEYGFAASESSGWTRTLADEPRPVPAVSVIPLRDGPSGLEVFVQHRVPTMDFVPGAVVFPGSASTRRTWISGFVRPTRGFRRATSCAGRRPDTWLSATRRPRFARSATGVREMAEETSARVGASGSCPGTTG